MNMYDEIQSINTRPEPFGYYTAKELWDDEYTSKMMLEYHLNKSVDVSSRNYSFIESSLKWIIDRFGIDEGSSVCDFGCAVGHYTSGFAGCGARVTGLDFSRSSIAYAKRKARESSHNINYQCMNYLDYKPYEEHDLVTMIMCDFCALSPVQRGKLLEIFHKSLKDGGHVLLDVYSMDAFDKVEEKAIYEKNQLGGFWAESDYYAFLNTFKYEQEALGLDKYTIIESDRVRVVYNWLQYFSPDSLTCEFEEAGFKVEGLYSDVAGGEYSSDSSEFAVVAVKV